MQDPGKFPRLMTPAEPPTRSRRCASGASGAHHEGILGRKPEIQAPENRRGQQRLSCCSPPRLPARGGRVAAHPWEARAVEVGAKRRRNRGELLQSLWSKDKYMAHLDQSAVERMERFFEFAAIPPNRDVFRQDEYGCNFMVVLLTGTIAVGPRCSPGAKQLRLAETRRARSWAKMAARQHPLLGVHHAHRLRIVAVLSADAMDEMICGDPRLAASLVAHCCRAKLSLRLRAVSARLSKLNAETNGGRRNAMERDQASKFINDLLKLMVSRGGSDLFITADFPPAIIKVDGKVTRSRPARSRPCTHDALARSIMSDKRVADFERTKELPQLRHRPARVSRFRLTPS